jgi:DNA-directed RNA polymerase subunit RPC12/RpoP
MVKKSLGYVELEWVCPQCDSRNKGTSKKCTNCGAPQPEDVQFHQAPDEPFITDKAKIARAKAGPDIHCPYCGTRNLATAEKCVQCGGDLTGGTVRESGRVLGAHRTEPAEEVACPHCGASNPATAQECSQCGGAMKPVATPRPARQPAERTRRAAARPKRKINPMAIVGIAVAALILIAFCVVIVLSMLPSDEITGTVQSKSWERSIAVEALQDVTHEAWQDEIPVGAPVGDCTEKVHHTQPNPAPGSVEVCGTPYTVDTGTGMGEVMQDCEYQVYEDWCEYTEKEWMVVDTVVLSGSDMNPVWPDIGAGTNRREGERDETYRVVFATEDKTYTRAFTDMNRWREFTIGSRWLLTTNKLGGIKSIEPVE